MTLVEAREINPPANPNSGGAYVMWKGTPYAHIMVPVAQRPAAQK